jgi:pSer/pThr/pTyr-binding forkhead associated (FHA) protein
MYKLIFEKGSLTGRIYEFSEGRIVVGRDPDSRLRLRDDGVSRQHCYFEERKDGVFVRDMGSTNGVFVNNEKVTDHKLNTGDRVKIGAALVLVEIEGQAAPAPAKEEKDTIKTPAGEKPLASPAASAGAASRLKSDSSDRGVSRPRSGSLRAATPPSAAPSNLTMVLAGVALLCVLGTLIWVTMLQTQLRDLEREMRDRALQPTIDHDLSGKVDELRREMNDIKLRQLQQRPPAPEPPRPPPPDNAPQSAIPAPGQKMKFDSPIVADKQFADDAADERVDVYLKLRFANASSFDPSKAKIIVFFYETPDGNAVIASLSSPMKTVAGVSSWRAGASATVETSYVIPKGGRAKERQETGQQLSFYGLAARAYYADELQDSIFFPADFPRHLR